MLRRLREKTIREFVPLHEVKRTLPPYPPDHKLGMRVPKGGSACIKCMYLKDPKTCGEKHFIKWNRGSGKLPAPADSYCCDFFDH